MIEGRLIQIGTPREIYESPRSVYVAARLGQPRINLIPAGLLPDGGAPAGARTIGARTEHFKIAKARTARRRRRSTGSSISATRATCISVVGEHKLVTLVDPHTELRSGDAVTVELVDPLYFDQSGNRIGRRPCLTKRNAAH